MKRNLPTIFAILLLHSAILPLTVFGKANAGACDPPFLLSVSNITTSSATLNWVPVGTEMEWDVAVVPQGSPSPALPTLAGVTSFPVIHPGLASATAYDFYVRAVCDSVPGNWAKFNSFFITGLTNPSNCRVGLQIPDNNCRTYNIWVDNAPGAEMGYDVFLQEVRVILRHQWDDDVDMSLISPDGVEVNLSSDNGGNEEHYGNPFDPQCEEYTTFLNILAQGACGLPSITEGQAPFIGTFLPEEPLTLFHTGSNPNAVWRLKICDDAGDDTGRLEFVELVFAPLICRAPSGVSADAVDSTFALLTWMPGDSCQGTLIEFGPVGFTPGIDENAGPGGTVVPGACPPFVLSGLDPETDYEIYIREACPGGGFTANSCSVALTTLCSPLPVTQWEDFNDEEVCVGICSTPCELQGFWINSRADALDWLAGQGPTETPGTGPDDDFPGGGRYIYLEGSGSCPTNSEAILYSHCMEIVAPPGSSCHFSFDYHMFGTAVNSLALEITIDGGQNWQGLWSLSGNQGDQWVRQFIDLSAYHGENGQLRFIGKKGSNLRSDIGLDNLIFYGSMDQGAPSYVYFRDFDQDGYGNSAIYFATCEPITPPGFAAQGGDCIDFSAEISPGLPESPCDGFDINCNGMDDEWILPQPLVQNDTVCAGDFGVVSAEPAYGGLIIWYDAPVGGQALDTGFFYLPNPPLSQMGEDPLVYTFYAEEANSFGCVSANRGEAAITVLPQPDLFIPSAQLAPVCAGDTIDLSALIFQVFNSPTASLSFHTSYPPSSSNQISPLVNPLFSTTYYVLATAPGGCTDTDSVLVEVKDSPIAQISGDSELCKGTVGVLQVSDAGSGVLPLDYVWSNASNATSIVVVGSGPVGSTSTYGVTITDANGCRSSDSFDVEVIGAISSVLMNEQDVNTCGGSNGAIQMSINGGVAPFQIAWSGPVSGSAISASTVYQISNLMQGTYSITVTDSSPTPCPFVIPFAIVNGPQAHVSITSIEPVSCYGAMDGCIELNVSGVNPVVTWSTGASGTESLCGIDGGIYSVTVTDGACENVLSGIIVQEPDTLSGKIAFLKNVSCFGAMDGQIIAVVGGGTAPYEYLWSNGQTTLNLLNADPGSYTLTVTDARGCQLALGPNEITGPPPISLNISATPVPCTNGIGGALEVAVSGGVEPYGYAWSTGASIPAIANLEPGTYGLTVTDVTGCSVTTAAVLPNPPPLVAEADPLISPSCFGVADGQLGVSVSGGLPPYTYAWSTGDTLPILTLPAGEYSVTVTDAAGCTIKVDAIELTAPNAVTVIPAITPASCLGEDNGAIQLTPQNGLQPFVYMWENGGSGPLLTGLEAGTYPVTITDANGCESALSFEIPFNQPMSATVSPLGPNCADGANGKIFLNVVGGSPFYHYSWNSGQQTKDLLDIPAGVYVCTITDMAGCLLIIDTVALQNPEPILIELLALDSISCSGAADGLIDMQVSGGFPPYLYTWTNEATTEDLSGVNGGTYMLTVEDALNCAVNGPLIVLPEPSPLQITAEAVDNIINCQSNTIDTLFVEISGGSAPYQITWSNGQTEPFVLGSPPGDYSVTVTDAQGCADSLSSLKVPEPVPFLTLSLSTDFSFSGDCDNPASSASLKVNINGGQAPFQYNWSSGVQGTTNSHTLVLNNLQEDTYSVTVTDAQGCVAYTNPVQVNFPDPLNVVVTGSSIGDVNCKFGIDGFIHPLVNGGKQPYQFIWEDQTGATVGISQYLDSIPAGIYTLTVIDQNGCIKEVSGLEVEEPIAELAVSISVVQIDCFGDNDGAISASAFGGTPLYSYSWNIPGSGAMQPNLQPGFYSLTVEDNAGCLAAIDSIEITAPESPLNLDSAVVSPILCNGSGEGAIDIGVSGGTPPYDYIWSNGKLTEDIGGLGPGNYKCTIVDAKGCQLVTQVFSLSNPPALIVNEFVIDTATFGMSDGALEVLVQGGTIPYTYLWSSGDTTSVADSLASGTYSVTVTDANGCVLESQVYLPFRIIDGASEAFGNGLRIYPNPARDLVWIELPDGLAAEAELRLWDTWGRLLRAETLADPSIRAYSLDLEGLPSGVYRLELLAGGQAVARSWLLVQATR